MYDPRFDWSGVPEIEGPSYCTFPSTATRAGVCPKATAILLRRVVAITTAGPLEAAALAEAASLSKLI
jgi:hypothetical protein